MVTKSPIKPQGAATTATRPKAASKQPARRSSELNADQRRQLDEAIAERMRNPASWAGQTKEQVEKEETKKLLKSLKGKKKHSKSGDCGGGSPCGDKDSRQKWTPYQRRDVGLVGGQVFQRIDTTRSKGIAFHGLDVELLADIVFQRLIFEARIERERTGWAG